MVPALNFSINSIVSKITIVAFLKWTPCILHNRIQEFTHFKLYVVDLTSVMEWMMLQASVWWTRHRRSSCRRERWVSSWAPECAPPTQCRRQSQQTTQTRCPTHKPVWMSWWHRWRQFSSGKTSFLFNLISSPHYIFNENRQNQAETGD